jgi:hypothetical protein
MKIEATRCGGGQYLRIMLLLFSIATLNPAAASSDAACVRYDCKLDFDHSKHHEFNINGTILDPTKDKPIFVCENFPYRRCGPGQQECSGHCINRPGEACKTNDDCHFTDPAPAPAPGPLHIAVPVPYQPPKPRPTSEVCWDAPWNRKEECSLLGGGTGQCYGSRAACFRAGGKKFLDGFCGHTASLNNRDAACGCCLSIDDAGDNSHRDGRWPTPSPSVYGEQFYLSNRSIMFIAFLAYLLLNTFIILTCRCCIRVGCLGGQSKHQQRRGTDRRGAYSRIEDGGGVGDGEQTPPVSLVLRGSNICFKFCCVTIEREGARGECSLWFNFNRLYFFLSDDPSSQRRLIAKDDSGNFPAKKQTGQFRGGESAHSEDFCLGFHWCDGKAWVSRRRSEWGVA